MFPLVKFTMSAPGKVILFGEHSVVYNKPALAASINKRTALTCETTSLGSVEIEFPDLDWEIKLPVDELNDLIGTRSSSDVDYLLNQTLNDVTNLKNSDTFSVNQTTSLRCVFYLLRGLFSSQKISTGFRMDLSSQLCIGAGTGSSASFAVCLTAALYLLHKLFQISGNEYSEQLWQFSSKDKEEINEWAFACEQIIHGKASGIDNYVCTYGSVVEVRSNGTDEGKIFKVLAEAPKLRILLINTGISRNTSALVKKVAQLRKNNSLVVEFVLRAMEEIVNNAGALLQQISTRREPITAVNGDNADMATTTIFSRLEELVSLNQGLLTSLGVSHESLDSIVNITKKYNLHSKLTGAGGGGYAITLIPPYSSDNNIQDCIAMLQKNGFAVDDIIVGDRGVDIETHSKIIL